MSLEEFAKDEVDTTILQLRSSGMSMAAVADAIGVTERNVYKRMAALRQRAAQGGVAPAHGWNNPLPDGFALAGVSELKDADGATKLQWFKSKADTQRQMELLVERIESAHQGIKPYKPTKPPEGSIEDLLTLLTITDFHLGMYAYEAETGDNWDVTIARNVFLDSVATMIESSPNSGTGVLCQLGDFLHWDGILSASTPMSGHALDADTRYSKLVELAMSVMVEATRMMLEKFERVIIVSAEGNHDVSGSIWLRKHIKHIFQDDKRLEVIDNDFPYYAIQHGKTMLGFHHGHKRKLAQLHKLFASEPRFRAMWGATEQCYIHTGHYHSERVLEDGGAIAEQHPTLSGRDAYAARGGWVSQRGAKVITYHKEHGEVSRTTIRPDA